MDYEDDYQDELRRDNRIKKQLSPYDGELDKIEAEIETTKDLKRTVEERLSKLELRRSDLQLERSRRETEHRQGMDSKPNLSDFPDIARFVNRY